MPYYDFVLCSSSDAQSYCLLAPSPPSDPHAPTNCGSTRFGPLITKKKKKNTPFFTLAIHTIPCCSFTSLFPITLCSPFPLSPLFLYLHSPPHLSSHLSLCTSPASSLCRHAELSQRYLLLHEGSLIFS